MLRWVVPNRRITRRGWNVILRFAMLIVTNICYSCNPSLFVLFFSFHSILKNKVFFNSHSSNFLTLSTQPHVTVIQINCILSQRFKCVETHIVDPPVWVSCQSKRFGYVLAKFEIPFLNMYIAVQVTVSSDYFHPSCLKLDGDCLDPGWPSLILLCPLKSNKATLH